MLTSNTEESHCNKRGHNGNNLSLDCLVQITVQLLEQVLETRGIQRSASGNVPQKSKPMEEVIR